MRREGRHSTEIARLVVNDVGGGFFALAAQSRRSPAWHNANRLCRHRSPQLFVSLNQSRSLACAYAHAMVSTGSAQLLNIIGSSGRTMECGLLLSEGSQQRSTCEHLFMGFCRFTVCMVGCLLGSLFYFCCLRAEATHSATTARSLECQGSEGSKDRTTASTTMTVRSLYSANYYLLPAEGLPSRKTSITALRSTTVSEIAHYARAPSATQLIRHPDRSTNHGMRRVSTSHHPIGPIRHLVYIVFQPHMMHRRGPKSKSCLRCRGFEPR